MATDTRNGRPTVPNRYGVVRFTIGLVPELYEWICDLAEQEERTVQAQIAYILKEKRRTMMTAVQSEQREERSES